jgi:hypothetical protein
LQDDFGVADVFMSVPDIGPGGGVGVAVVPPAFTQVQLVNAGSNVTVAQTTAPGVAGDGLFIVNFPRPMVARVLPSASPSTTYGGVWQVTLV